MIFFMFFGGLIFFDEPVHLIRGPTRNVDGSGTDRLKLDTMCFHTFVLMNIFNQINCRVVDADATNVFKSVFRWERDEKKWYWFDRGCLRGLRVSNPYFWLVIAFELAVQ